MTPREPLPAARRRAIGLRVTIALTGLGQTAAILAALWWLR